MVKVTTPAPSTPSRVSSSDDRIGGAVKQAACQADPPFTYQQAAVARAQRW